ncbi:MAG: FeoA family protein [Candidatus Dependentiae bacterium]|jgi:Fe2+ transport system protein FeoA
MTLLELLEEQTATIVQLLVPAAEQERLESRGISIGTTIRKSHESHATQPIVISTHSHNTFAMSRSLAQKIIITPFTHAEHL